MKPLDTSSTKKGVIKTNLLTFISGFRIHLQQKNNQLFRQKKLTLTSRSNITLQQQKIIYLPK